MIEIAETCTRSTRCHTLRIGFCQVKTNQMYTQLQYAQSHL